MRSFDDGFVSVRYFGDYSADRVLQENCCKYSDYQKSDENSGADANDEQNIEMYQRAMKVCLYHHFNGNFYNVFQYCDYN